MDRFSTLAAALTTLAALGGAVSGCGLNQKGVSPPGNTIAFPSSAVTDSVVPNGPGKWLFVVNSNADLRYNDGTLVVVDLVAAAQARDAVMPFEQCPTVGYVNPRVEGNEDYCCWDRLDREVLNCDERRFIKRDNSVQLGSFGAGMLYQHWECPLLNPDANPPGTAVCSTCATAPANPPSRLLIAVRGDTSLTFVDLDRPADPATQPPILRCAGAVGTSTGYHICADDHKVTDTEALEGAQDTPSPTVVRLPDEPYALALDYSRGHLYLGHLTGDTGRPGTGGVSLFFAGPAGDTLRPPFYRGPLGMPFPPNANGLVGVTSLLWRFEPSRGANEIYATSRYQALASGVTVTDFPCREGEQEVAIVGRGASFGSPLVGEQTRGIQFVQDQAFVLQRSPPALVGYSGTTPVTVQETCSSPTFLYKFNPEAPLDVADGPGTRLYVNCQDTGEVYIFDPFIPRLEKVFLIGRAPAGLVFAQSPTDGKSVAYAVGFGDNNISVVDLDPVSPTRHHVIQRIGFPSTVPR